jgi:hypothetical protein
MGFDKGATGSRQEMILGICAGSATTVQPVAIPEPRLERTDIDVVGPFQRNDQGNRYLLFAMDYFTKWPEAYAIPNQESSTVAEALVANYFCRLRVPRELYSDQGRNFESRPIQEALQLLGVSKIALNPRRNRTA